MAPVDLSRLQTESRNPRSAHIDTLSSLEICQIINHEDSSVASVVARCLPILAAAVDAIADRVRRGGRVIYIGAGTSGRLGVLDASEIPPTYSASHEQFVGLIAGGDAAIRRAQEGAEDRPDVAEADLAALRLGPNDTLIGIAASGQTPYVLGGLAHGKKCGCVTVGVVCCSPSRMGDSGLVDFLIAPVTGPEVVTGSTRMKAGTATKLVLNTLSTAVMIRVGKTFGNMMVDLKPSNSKLQQRSRNILRALGGNQALTSDSALDFLLLECGSSVKLALAVLRLGVSVDGARFRLNAADGVLAKAIEQTSPADCTELKVRNASSLMLCVDGGATKCAAVVYDSEGRMGEGRAGPCNVYIRLLTSSIAPINSIARTDIDVPRAISTIRLAIEDALENLAQRTKTETIALSSASFKAAWVGLAGYERANLQPRIDAALAELLGAPIGLQLRVSADIDLLASAIPRTASSGIVLIAGTGSIAIRYSIENGTPAREARSGGWGHLLGDDGGGFDLGKRALRRTLAALDAAGGLETNLGDFHRCVLAYLGLNAKRTSSAALLTSVMLTEIADEVLYDDSRDSSSILDPRRRIAELAHVVLSITREDPDAEGIVNEGINGLVRMVMPLVRPVVKNAQDTRQSALVLSGGLMRDENYRTALLKRLGNEGLSFESVKLVQNPAQEGASFLFERERDVAMRPKL